MTSNVSGASSIQWQAGSTTEWLARAKRLYTVLVVCLEFTTVSNDCGWSFVTMILSILLEVEMSCASKDVALTISCKVFTSVSPTVNCEYPILTFKQRLNFRIRSHLARSGGAPAAARDGAGRSRHGFRNAKQVHVSKSWRYCQ